MFYNEAKKEALAIYEKDKDKYDTAIKEMEKVCGYLYKSRQKKYFSN